LSPGIPQYALLNAATMYPDALGSGPIKVLPLREMI
jgi:hypothetical protein